jgi:signal transduction histidine kinase
VPTDEGSAGLLGAQPGTVDDPAPGLLVHPSADDPAPGLLADPLADGSAPGGGDLASADLALLRRTRLRLTAWSSILTLAILVVLGAAIYIAVQGSLSARGSTLLEGRAADIGRVIAERGHPPDGPGLGFVFGGNASGTLAVVVAPDGSLVGLPPNTIVSGVPVTAAVTSAVSGTPDVREISIDTVPVRVYSLAVPGRDGTYVVQVIGERASELDLLRSLLIVLVVGGLLALLLAVGLGWLYGGRALVPIRASMSRRDEALRRQREFTANASHELRAPLTIVRASVADLQRNRAEPVERVGTALDDIDAEIVHLAALVDDLLLLARTDSGEVDLAFEPVDLGDVAAEAAGMLAQVAADRGISLVVDPRPAIVDGDPLRLRQLVTILVDNALAHGPRGSTVSVTVREDAGWATLDVDDGGPGFRPADLPHVFDRFWRADDAPEGGTGLGLAIAAWIVERHAGTIAAANRPDGGAHLSARLPVHQAHPAHA